MTDAKTKPKVPTIEVKKVAPEIFKWVKSTRNVAVYSSIGFIVIMFLAKLYPMVATVVSLCFFTYNVLIYKKTSMEYERINSKYNLEQSDFLNNIIFKKNRQKVDNGTKI